MTVPVTVPLPPERAGDARFGASWRRLQAPDYDVERVLHDGVTGDWPADLPGRLVLGLSRLAAVAGREPRQLRELVDALPGRLNAAGHLGPVHRDAADEQQLAGHGWLVSGLLTYHRLAGDERARHIALEITRTLLLPVAARLPGYPRRLPGDDTAGGASGSLVARGGGWLLSSDTYCVLIALEGLVAAYADTADPAIADAVEALAALAERDDLVAARAQLHATLTAARCLADFHELTGSPRPLAVARRLYDTYAEHGRTANAATWNWFGRPDSWTEPCAVTDSLLLALSLWRVTGESRYLEDAHAVEHNGLGHAQKPHGGFGLDTVTGPGQPWLSNVHPDAAWCCTMRGAVALAELRERTYQVRDVAGPGPATVSVDLPRDGTTPLALPGGELVLRQRTGHPFTGATSLEVVRSGLRGPVRIAFPLPSWADRSATVTTATGPGQARVEGPGLLLVAPAPGDRYTVDFPVGPRTVPASGDGRHVTLRHGVLLLGAVAADGGPAPRAPSDLALTDPSRARYRYAGGVRLAPVAEVFHGTEQEAAGYRARVVFGA
ncbi:hypothetical protein [Streptomyces sp. NPDC021020]|uniref:hypothetical protein n=1 Tax=Streptomyces sp. NPDC021020 TaxID=3365109 RepID=UPI0037979E37